MVLGKRPFYCERPFFMPVVNELQNLVLQFALNDFLPPFG